MALINYRVVFINVCGSKPSFKYNTIIISILPVIINAKACQFKKLPNYFTYILTNNHIYFQFNLLWSLIKINIYIYYSNTILVKTKLLSARLVNVILACMSTLKHSLFVTLSFGSIERFVSLRRYLTMISLTIFGAINYLTIPLSYY